MDERAMMAALTAQKQKDERAANLAALSMTNANNMEYLNHSGGYDAVLEEFAYQRDLLNEVSTNEANECALMALAFSSNDGNERAELAALFQEEPREDERAAMAALSEETQWIERAAMAAPSNSQQKEIHDDTADDAAESDERASMAAPQALEKFEPTRECDVVNTSVEEKIDTKAQEEVPTRATSSVERASMAAHQDQEELSHDTQTDALRSWVFCTGWSMY